MKAFGDLFIGRVFSHRHICRGHHGWNTHRRILSVWRLVIFFLVYRMPNNLARRCLNLLPLITKEKIKVTVVPYRMICRPSSFKAAGNSVTAHTRCMTALPTKTHVLQRCPFRLSIYMLFISSAMSFTEGMAASNKSNSFLIVHSHSPKCFTNVFTARQWIRITVRALGVNIN